MSFWTDERLDRLRALAATGLSASEASKELGAVSRNAVIGKAHRHGITFKSYNSNEACRERGVLNPRTRSHKKKADNVIRLPKLWSTPAMAREYLSTDCSIVCTVPLIDLGPGDCRWPQGDGPYTFCGAAVVDGAPYCAGHCRLSYLPPRNLSEAQRQQMRIRGQNNLARMNDAKAREDAA